MWSVCDIGKFDFAAAVIQLKICYSYGGLNKFNLIPYSVGHMDTIRDFLGIFLFQLDLAALFFWFVFFLN